MLAIRMQRTGRKGHAMFRVIVQDARRTPTSGKVVARLGSYDPHAKTVTLDKEKASFYLDHGAQPSDRVVRLLKDEGIKLPGWVKPPTTKENPVRNPDKRRSTRPASAEPAEVSEPAEASAPEAPAETSATPEAAADQPPEESEAATPAEEKADEATTETPVSEDATPAGTEATPTTEPGETAPEEPAPEAPAEAPANAEPAEDTKEATEQPAGTPDTPEA